MAAVVRFGLHLYNKCLSTLRLQVQFPSDARSAGCKFTSSSLSVTCGRSSENVKNDFIILTGFIHTSRKTWESEWLLLNAIWAIFQLYHGDNNLHLLRWKWCLLCGWVFSANSVIFQLYHDGNKLHSLRW